MTKLLKTLFLLSLVVFSINETNVARGHIKFDPKDQLIKIAESYRINTIANTIRHLKTAKGIQYLSWRQADVQARIINKLSKLYNINWKLITAITFVESSFDQFNGGGPMQITYSLWAKWCNMKNRGMEEGYRCGVKVLDKMRRRWYDKEDWWAYYHSATTRHRVKYRASVERQLRKINEFIKRNNANAVLYL